MKDVNGRQKRASILLEDEDDRLKRIWWWYNQLLNYRLSRLIELSLSLVHPMYVNCARSLKRHFSERLYAKYRAFPLETSGCGWQGKYHRVGALHYQRVEARSPLWKPLLAHRTLVSPLSKWVISSRRRISGRQVLTRNPQQQVRKICTREGTEAHK